MSPELLKCWKLLVLNLAVVLSSTLSRCVYALIYSCRSPVSPPAYPFSFSSTYLISLKFFHILYSGFSIFSVLTFRSFILLSIHTFSYSLFSFSSLFSLLTSLGFFFFPPVSIPPFLSNSESTKRTASGFMR